MQGEDNLLDRKTNCRLSQQGDLNEGDRGDNFKLNHGYIDKKKIEGTSWIGSLDSLVAST